MSLDRPTPKGYRRAWNGGQRPPPVPFAKLRFKAEALLRDGEQLVVEPDEEGGGLVARRALRVVGYCETPGWVLAEVRARAGIAVGTVLPAGDEPAGHATLQLS
jgi:hypothetical protein